VLAKWLNCVLVVEAIGPALNFFKTIAELGQNKSPWCSQGNNLSSSTSFQLPIQNAI
jgi:hypothetical protein